MLHAETDRHEPESKQNSDGGSSDMTNLDDHHHQCQKDDHNTENLAQCVHFQIKKPDLGTRATQTKTALPGCKNMQCHRTAPYTALTTNETTRRLQASSFDLQGKAEWKSIVSGNTH